MINLIFDLDGTLIDSMDSVLDALAAACKVDAITLRQCPINGKTLDQTIDIVRAKISLVESSAAIKKKFIELYDAEFCVAVKFFHNVDKILPQLARNNHLFLVTNKRRAPTVKILDCLGFSEYFAEVYCIDDLPAPCEKANLIMLLASDHGVKASDCVYIGDTMDDFLAATNCGMSFIHAAWDRCREHESIEGAVACYKDPYDMVEFF